MNKCNRALLLSKSLCTGKNWLVNGSKIFQSSNNHQVRFYQSPTMTPTKINPLMVIPKTNNNALAIIKIDASSSSTPQSEKWTKYDYVLLTIVALVFGVSLYDMIKDIYNGNVRKTLNQFIQEQIEDAQRHPATYALLASNTLIYLVGKRTRRFQDRHMFLSLKALQERRYYTTITSGMNHVFFLHLFFNMYALHDFRDAEERVGSAKYLGIYFTAVILSGLAFFALSHRRSTAKLLGASGGVYGIFGLYMCTKPVKQSNISSSIQDGAHITTLVAVIDAVLVILAIDAFLWLVWRRSPIAHSAHIAGLLVGSIAATTMIYLKDPNVITIRSMKDYDTHSSYVGETKLFGIPHGYGKKQTFGKEIKFEYIGMFSNGLLQTGSLVCVVGNLTAISEGRFIMTSKGLVLDGDGVINMIVVDEPSLSIEDEDEDTAEKGYYAKINAYCGFFQNGKMIRGTIKLNNDTEFEIGTIFEDHVEGIFTGLTRHKGWIIPKLLSPYTTIQGHQMGYSETPIKLSSEPLQ